MTEDIYEVAVRTWIARQIEDGDRKVVTASDIRNPEFITEHGFQGSDVTPADDPWTAIQFEIRQRTGFANECRWRERSIALHLTPVQLVHEILSVVHSILAGDPQ